MGVIVDCGTGKETPVPDSHAVLDVPEHVTRYQFFSAIRATGKAAQLKTYIQGLPEAKQEEWLNRKNVYRNSAIVAAAAAALGVGNGAVDNLFFAAAEVED